MNNTINIINNDSKYKVCKWFQNHIPHLANYLIKIVGINHIEKKHHVKKIKEGKKPGKSMKDSVYAHVLRKMKNKLNAKNHIHESTTSH